MAHEVSRRQQHHIPHGYRQGEGAYQLLLLLGELAQGKLRDERHALSAFHHAHEGLYAAERVFRLTLRSRLQIAEPYELVAEAMALVEKPQELVVQVGSLDVLIGIQRVVLGDVGDKLLVVHGCLLINVQLLKPYGDGGINLSPVQRLLDVGSFHLYYVEVYVGVLPFELRKEARQQIRSYGRQYAYLEGARQRVLLLGDNLLNLVSARDNPPCLFHHELSDGGRCDLLRGAFENLHSQFLLQLLYHGAQRRLRHTARFRSLGKVSQPIHSHDIFHLL